MRDATCRDCQALTSGDCGKHGPVTYTTTNWPDNVKILGPWPTVPAAPPAADETQRLVERLRKASYRDLTDGALVHETVAALERLRAREIWWTGQTKAEAVIGNLEREKREQAEAEVARLREQAEMTLSRKLVDLVYRLRGYWDVRPR
jgi:hypothetical protein